MQSSEEARPIGFSTGALALSDWQAGVNYSRQLGVDAIELSVLRYAELDSFIASINSVDVSDFLYVSVHLPSGYLATDEPHVLSAVEKLAERGWPLVVHPDVIIDWNAWRTFGSLICLENMDKRKPMGRTVKELSEAFEQLPEARFCFDYGHARQVDHTMSQATHLLLTFGERLQQIHFSDVDTTNRHRPLNFPALVAFARLRNIPVPSAAVILETQVSPLEAMYQLQIARAFFSNAADFVLDSSYQMTYGLSTTENVILGNKDVVGSMSNSEKTFDRMK